ncbi:MAG: MMPL family transporter [Actinobacteria bacterium]|nr:MMPL family transporter [Actinomycetota bacterium]
MANHKYGHRFFTWLGNFLERRSTWIIVTVLLITALLVIPLLLMSPTESASENPSGSEVVKLQDEISDKFTQEIFYMGYIIQARDGDMLTRDNLVELFKNEQKLRESDLGSFLETRYNPDTGWTTQGASSIADHLNYGISDHTGGAYDLSSANDSMIKQAVGIMLDDPSLQGLGSGISVKAEKGEDGWTSPVVFITVIANDEKVTDEYTAADGESYEGELAREHFARDVQTILNGGQDNYEALGIAIDLDLEIQDESSIAGMMIMVAMLLIAILMLVIFRSFLITLITTLGLGMLIVWLKGFSNLAGLKSSMILDLIVPISILVLGIEYAIQSLFRYREEIERGKSPDRALRDSTSAVGAAILLAALTTTVAFASNASSNIESVRQFSFAASFAILAALIILGLFVPAVVMRFQLRRYRLKGTVSKNRRGKARERGEWLGRLVVGVSRKWFIVLPVILVISGFALAGWLNVETRMDAKDALDSGSDFVRSLDLIDLHVGERGGESAFIYIEGDLSRPEAVEAIKTMVGGFDDNENISRGIDGNPNPEVLLFDVFEVILNEEYPREVIEEAGGVSITDDNGNGIPDTGRQLSAIYDYIVRNGVPESATGIKYSPRHITSAFIHDPAGTENDAVVVYAEVPGTREQEIVKASMLEFEEDMKTLEGIPGIVSFGLTGSGYIRVEQFDAIARSMTLSLAIAAFAVLLLLILIFRSLKYAFLAMIPVLLVACWLYGFMYIAGYYLNMMTATIAAISIGVSIDFSIHFTERFREEQRNGLDKVSALREAGRTTGLGLLGTGVTTTLGFAVIAFAPMPMFATYGVLTAMMIVLAVFMALFVLPSLLQLFIKEDKKPVEAVPEGPSN